MSDPKYVTKKENVNKCLNWADGDICKILDSGKVAKVTIEEHEPRTSSTNAKYHAMINDIHKLGVYRLPGRIIVMRDYDIEEAKSLLVVWFAYELQMIGEPLKKPPRRVTDPFTGEQYTVRPSTIDFEKEEAGKFIEFLYATGAATGVKWSEPALKEYEQYREAQK